MTDAAAPPRLYFRQLLAGRDIAQNDPIARQMVNFVYLIGDRETGEAVVIDPAYDPAGILGVLAAFVIARYDFRGRDALYSLFTAGLLFPITVAILPLYLMLQGLGLVNTLAGVIIPQIAFQLPVTIIILVPFLRAIPDEIQEAAFIDGCSRIGFFFRMVLRLSLPGVITVGILAFIASWNSYLLPLFILNDQASFTLPLGVQAFSSQYATDTSKVLAFTSLSMIPALIFFSLFERRIVGGLTGAVKG